MSNKKTITCSIDSLKVQTSSQNVFLELDGETPGILPMEAFCLEGKQKMNVGIDYN